MSQEALKFVDVVDASCTTLSMLAVYKFYSWSSRSYAEYERILDQESP